MIPNQNIAINEVTDELSQYQKITEFLLPRSLLTYLWYSFLDTEQTSHW